MNNKGNLSIPLLLTIALFAICALAIHSYFRTIRGAIITQYRLDQCLGQKALDTARALNQIESSNLRILVARESLRAPSILPPVRATLIATLSAEHVLQTLVAAKWAITQTEWTVKQGCDSTSDLALPLPKFPYRFNPPDDLGFLPSSIQTKTITLRIQHAQIYSAAILSKSHEWVPKWTNFN